MRISRNSKMIACGIAVVAFFAAAILFFFTNHYRPPDKKIQLRYSLSIQNTTNQPITDVSLKVQSPVQSTLFQRRIDMRADHEFEEIGKDSENQLLHFKWALVPPFTTKVISIQSNVEFWSKPQKADASDLDIYLLPEALIESDHPQIKTLADQLHSVSKEKTIRNTYEWVSEKIAYSGYIKHARGAIYALKHGQGDCTEFAYLFVALCRANEVPARVIGGFVCSNDAVLDLGEYHNWAEFLLDGSWHIADPQRKQFMRAQEAYIAFHIGRPTDHEGFAMVSEIEGSGLKVKLNK
ncbi:MAG: transglutaminase-like domain-containing protein [Desulfatitalea sp.]